MGKNGKFDTFMFSGISKISGWYWPLDKAYFLARTLVNLNDKVAIGCGIIFNGF
jgi:hypothetical protein